MGVITWSPLAGGWLSGKYRKDRDIDLTSGRAQRIPGRFDPSLPGNQRKLEIVEELIKVAADAGTSLTHLAIAFAITHPAVTAAIIGPRTMDQLQDLLAGADVALATRSWTGSMSSCRRGSRSTLPTPAGSPPP